MSFDNLNSLFIEISDEDEELMQMFNSELDEAFNELESFENQILLSDEFDHLNAIVEIHPGAGGVEAHDWADMLSRMYLRWCEKKDYKVEILDYIAGEEAGIKRIAFEVKGKFIYGLLKGEKGVHRLVRISPFDSNKRRHTSFASVDISPVFEEEIQIDIKDEDLKVDTYRASGAGGQHVNKTDSAVRITHLPSNIVVSCQNQRSQIQNRDFCMNILKGKLYEKMILEKKQEINKIKGENKINEWGSQIRSYVFCPYTLVKDVRTNVEIGDVKAVMDGNIDMFINAFLRKK